ncbi:MAG: hypothetical protein ACKO2K_03240 [Alphaproteobacteria bacterium]
MNQIRRSLLAAAVGAGALIATAVPALAHKQSMYLSVGPLVGSTSPLVIEKAGGLRVSQYGGGQLSLVLPAVRDAAGKKVTAPGNEIRLELRVNGVARSAVLPFDVVDGKAKAKGFLSSPQDIFKGDLVEVLSMGAYDSSGVRFGMSGVTPEANHPVVRTGLVFVIDSQSQIRFSRGGDVLVRTREGYMNSGFDKLLDPQGQKIDSPGVRVEVEYSVNGGPSQVESYSYDIVNGRSRPCGRPHTNLGLTFDETVEVKRVDVFDADGNRFATMGVKIVSPRE